MKTIEHFIIDKLEWPDGPWAAEPDKKQWTDAATGLPCLIVRGPSGALCGYVGVSAEHPWHGQDYNACLAGEEHGYCWEHSPASQLDIHGGLTFSGSCTKDAGPDDLAICHVPDPGEPDDIWWFGFDCAHAGDLLPCFVDGDGVPLAFGAKVYRTIAYVEALCQRLAQQLHAVKEPQR